MRHKNANLNAKRVQACLSAAEHVSCPGDHYDAAAPMSSFAKAQSASILFESLDDSVVLSAPIDHTTSPKHPSNGSNCATASASKRKLSHFSHDSAHRADLQLTCQHCNTLFQCSVSSMQIEQDAHLLRQMTIEDVKRKRVKEEEERQKQKLHSVSFRIQRMNTAGSLTANIHGHIW
ncbi:hypothetical protein PoB_001737100 [Plakobranchus ocellatus]|uniref:C2H2-type domain-containing protein n=1 Tax=Plakobranchus ocellatus TaxID=259542 RepID=A0AAV3Z8B2_9GAST|nr:hypothetical protein PoB_001737100 [Plakobranchus ocellatus]